MSIAPAAVPVTLPSPDVPTMPIYRLSVAQYEEMARHGILTTNDRVELIHGWLVPKMTKNTPHTIATGLVQDALVLAAVSGWHARIQEPITLTDSVPEPDVTLARGGRRDYLLCHPGPADIGLLVEVSDTSLAHDRNVKRPLYGAANAPVYWIVNLEDNVLEVCTDPNGIDYATRRELGPADEVPLILDGREVARIRVRDLLP